MTSRITYIYLSDGTRLSVTLGDGSKVVGRGSFVYDVTPSGSVSLDSVSIPEGRIYCSGTPDGEPWTCWNLTDHLGNVRSVVLSGSGMPLEISDYLPFGTRMEEYSLYFEDSRRWHYAGKELQAFGQYESDLIDFGARQYCPHLCRWTTPDPLADRYPSTTPYAYCNSNPVNFVDPDGKAWRVWDLSFGLFIFWVDDALAKDEDGNLYPDFYESVIAFVPTKKEFDPSSTKNIGTSKAVVFDVDGNVAAFDACTYPSDLKKYPTIPEGTYEAKKGKHRGNYPALKMFDVGKDLDNNTIELGFPNPAYKDGRTYAAGVNIHKTGKRNVTTAKNGTPIISAGCFLIDRNRWEEFMRHFENLSNSSRVKVIVKR